MMTDMLKFAKADIRKKGRSGENIDFLKWLCTLPCLATGKMGKTQAHHLLDIPLRGASMKTPDRYSIPLDYNIHRALHDSGDETLFLAAHGITDAKEWSEQLYSLFQVNDYDTAYDLIIQRFL